MEYTNLENLKEYLGIEDNSKDLQLWKLIKTISKQFDNYLGFSLWEETYKQYVNIKNDYIIIDFTPITKIIKICKNNPAGEEIEYTRIDEQIIYIDSDYRWQVYIEYKAGYTDLENIADIENACLEICSSTYNDIPSSWVETNVKSKKIETLSKTYFSKSEMSGGIQMNFREILDNYKKNIYNPLRI